LPCRAKRRIPLNYLTEPSRDCLSVDALPCQAKDCFLPLPWSLGRVEQLIAVSSCLGAKFQMLRILSIHLTTQADIDTNSGSRKTLLDQSVQTVAGSNHYMMLVVWHWRVDYISRATTRFQSLLIVLHVYNDVP
jgi:hypothetical protein